MQQMQTLALIENIGLNEREIDLHFSRNPPKVGEEGGASTGIKWHQKCENCLGGAKWQNDKTFWEEPANGKLFGRSKTANDKMTKATLVKWQLLVSCFNQRGFDF